MSLSDSKLNMWRTVTALAHADGIFHQKEGCQIYGSQAGVKLADENIRNQISTKYGIE